MTEASRDYLTEKMLQITVSEGRPRKTEFEWAREEGLTSSRLGESTRSPQSKSKHANILQFLMAFSSIFRYGKSYTDHNRKDLRAYPEWYNWDKVKLQMLEHLEHIDI